MTSEEELKRLRRAVLLSLEYFESEVADDEAMDEPGCAIYEALVACRAAGLDQLPTLIKERLGLAHFEEIRCPRARSSMTPCVAKDGSCAAADDGTCVGCGQLCREILSAELTKRVT